MEFWLKQNNDAIQLPIPPSSFQVGIENGHQTINIQTKGNVSILGKKGLRSIELSSFFPGQDYYFSAYPMDRKPYEYIKKLESWIEKPIRLTITRTNVNNEFMIQSLTYGEPDGSGDVKFNLSLMQYRKPTYTKPKKELPPKLEPEKLDKKPITRPVKEPEKTYIVKQGDNLWNLAKKFYGSGSKQTKLYNANKDIIEKEARKHGFTSSSNKGVPGWWIFPGTNLVVPK